MTVVMTDDRITAIGKTKHFKIPKGARVVDAPGQFLIPGLWDMHVHTLAWEWQAEVFFPLFLANGVTGVRDMGGRLELLHRWREEVRAGRLLGPTLVGPGPIVDGPQPVDPEFSLAVADGEQARSGVRKLKTLGADFIKVYTLLPPEAYFALADEARKQGIPFAGHVPAGVSATQASDAGQKSIEHLTPFSGTDRPDFSCGQPDSSAKANECADVFARYVRNSTWQVPTLVTRRTRAYLDAETVARDARLKYVPQFSQQEWHQQRQQRLRRPKEYFDKLKSEYQQELALTRAMHQAGVRFLAGTDVGVPFLYPGFSLHDELALLVEAGLTPLEALQAATLNPARYLGKEKEFGTIEKGKIAALVLLDANPLEDIGNTRRIRAVVVGGRYFNRDSLDKLLDQARAAAAKTTAGELGLRGRWR